MPSAARPLLRNSHLSNPRGLFGVPMIWMAVSPDASIRGSTGAMVAMYAAIARLEECFEHQGELSS